jgi:hypothetical protein
LFALGKQAWRREDRHERDGESEWGHGRISPFEGDIDRRVV